MGELCLLLTLPSIRIWASGLLGEIQVLGPAHSQGQVEALNA